MLEEDAPELLPHLAWVWRAWHRLSHERPVHGGGMGPPIPGRIPWTAVRGWCDHHGIGQDAMEFLDTCFAAMDEEYLGWWKASLPAK